MNLVLRLDIADFRNTYSSKIKRKTWNDLTMNRMLGNAIDLVRGLPETPRIAVILTVIFYVLLWGVLDMLDFAFGTIYEWLALPLKSPESQLGAGLGGTVGVAVGIGYNWPWSAVIVGMGIGALLGGCICSGGYKLLFGHQKQVRKTQNRSR